MKKISYFWTAIVGSVTILLASKIGSFIDIANEIIPGKDTALNSSTSGIYSEAFNSAAEVVDATLLLIILMAILAMTYGILKWFTSDGSLRNDVKNTVRILNEYNATAQDGREVSESECADEYGDFLEELSGNAEILKKHRHKLKEMENEKLYDSVGKIIDTVCLIQEHTDRDEYMRGNIAKLNPQYLPALISLLEQYENLSSLDGAIKVRKTLNELSKTIIASETVFANILEEAVEDEKLSAEVDSKVFLQQATMNGTYADSNTLVRSDGSYDEE